MSTAQQRPSSSPSGTASATGRLLAALARALPDRPFEIELWDGRVLPSTSGSGPRFTARTPEALAYVLRNPGQLGLGRAYVSGLLEVDDIDQVMGLVDHWKPGPVAPADRARLVLAAVAAAGVSAPPPPAAELRPQGRRHTKDRDERGVRHHYDVSNDFFATFLDESMTYSCAIFSRGATTLEKAQEAKRDLICRKLDLRPGDRLLDVGCGWGAFAVHAAQRYGAHVTGITLSPPQAEGARARAAQAGVADRVDIRVLDYRDLAGEQFDKVASIGMVEHVGSEQIRRYGEQLASLLTPGGILLNHGIARLRHSDKPAGAFSERYVFPDGEPLQLSVVLDALERAGLVTRHVEDFQDDYAETLRHWAMRFDAHLDEATRIAGAERVRVWRLYLRAARNGFLNDFTSIYQVRAHKPAT